MIKIDQAKRQIRFIPNETCGEHPPMRTFLLLSAYQCPFCNRMLAAYFEGYMSWQDREYFSKEERATIGQVPGGLYLRLENHSGYSYYDSSVQCSWELFARRGIVANLRAFVEKYDLPKTLIQSLSDKIKDIPGFVLVKDICGQDGEMLLFSEDELLGDIRKDKGFDAYWEAKQNLGDYLMGLACRKVRQLDKFGRTDINF